MEVVSNYNYCSSFNCRVLCHLQMFLGFSKLDSNTYLPHTHTLQSSSPSSSLGFPLIVSLRPSAPLCLSLSNLICSFISAASQNVLHLLLQAVCVCVLTLITLNLCVVAGGSGEVKFSAKSSAACDWLSCGSTAFNWLSW